MAPELGDIRHNVRLEGRVIFHGLEQIERRFNRVDSLAGIAESLELQHSHT